MTKKICISVICIVWSFLAIAQAKARLSLFYSPYHSEVIVKNGLLSDSGHTGKTGNLFELRYSHPVNSRFSLEMGLQYSGNKVVTEYFPDGISHYTESEIKLISVPLYGNLTFLKYFYLEAGPTLDFEVQHKLQSSVQNQGGIGLAAGIGGKYTFKRISVFINPFVQRHLLVSFSNDKIYERLWQSGIKFGIGYSF